jgi:protein kinase-like protein
MIMKYVNGQKGHGFVIRQAVTGAGMKALTADDPRLIGEFRLRGRLGEGGMGRVYLGLSPAGRAVAIKVVHPSLASDSDFLRLFQYEVASAKAVSGIYTAPVVATGLDDHPPWLATAFVPGPSLAQVVREHGPLPEPALRPLLAGLTEALAAIHACGVVHRDLKPPNVLLAADGPRVIDFGISRAVEAAAVTATGAMFGTPGYMSPEQAEGKPASPASDVFALGCVIAYAATGSPPFGEGTPPSVLYRVVHSEPALDRLSPWLRELVTGCLAKDAAARPTPRALAAAISRRGQGTGPMAVSFWPQSVADLIGTYQPQLEAQMSEGRPLAEDDSTTYGVSVGASEGPAAYDAPARTGEPQDHADPEAEYGTKDVPGARTGQNGHAGVREKFPSPADIGTKGTAGRARPDHAKSPRVLMPESVRGAVRLMYASAAYALIWAICAVLIVDKGKNPVASLTLGSEVAVAAISCVIQVTVWLWVARACRTGRNWARVASTVFFGLYTVVALLVLIRYRHFAGGLIGTVLITATWLLGGGSVLLLWQRRSGSFFKGAGLA